MNIHRRRLIVVVLAALVAAGAAGPVAGNDDGSVVLPDGTVLPPLPQELASAPSVHAEMRAEHPALPAGTGDLPIGGITLHSDVATLEGGEATVETLASGPGGALPNGLRREVLGFLPYWLLGSDQLGSLRYDLLSTIAYFSIDARSDGTLVKGTSAGWTGWSSAAMTSVIANAKARGVKVVPTITMMAWDGNYGPMTTLLTSPTNRARLVGEIVSVVKARGVHGVNIDFEPVPTSLRSQFTTFVRELKAGLLKGGAGAYLTVDTMAGAASWATGYDVVGLTASGAADALMVMAYDFSYASSARAGGVAPEKSAYIFDATDALNAHLAQVPAHKLIWGVPYYGRTWPTQTDQLNSLTCRATSPPTCPESLVTAPGASIAYQYTGAKQLAAQHGRRWDSTGKVPWFRWYDTANKTWRQGYYDDPQSLRAKYDRVLANRLAGVGIWALGMDTGTSDLWNVLGERFVKRDIRISGADRYATAAAISAWRFSPGVPVAYVATGATFPDALAAGPAAIRDGGPVLLTQRDTLPAATRNELARVKPGRIVVLGSAASVSTAVANALKPYATTGVVQRVAGADRYATAAAISKASFPSASVVYVATGATFPDALAAGPVAGRAGAPILLVGRSSIPSATAAELLRLKPAQIVVLGGTPSVSAAVADALKSYAGSGTVQRLAGPDRYATAVAISKSRFGGGAGTVFLATGRTFPDGLAAAPVAGQLNGPLLLTESTRLTASTAAEIKRLNPNRIVILGGTPSVSNTVVAQLRALWD